MEHLGRRQKAPSRSSSRIVENVDVLVGNEEDLQKGLGIPGPEVGGQSPSSTPATFFGMIDKVVAKHPAGQGGGDDAARGALHQPPQLERRGLGRRQDLHRRPPPSSTCSTASAAATASRPASSTACSPAHNPEEAVKLGWAHGALLTTFPGDTTMATLDQVRAFAKGGSARIQR